MFSCREEGRAAYKAKSEQQSTGWVKKARQNIVFWCKLTLGILLKLFKESDIIKRMIAEDGAYYLKLEEGKKKTLRSDDFFNSFIWKPPCRTNIDKKLEKTSQPSFQSFWQEKEGHLCTRPWDQINTHTHTPLPPSSMGTNNVFHSCQGHSAYTDGLGGSV